MLGAHKINDNHLVIKLLSGGFFWASNRRIDGANKTMAMYRLNRKYLYELRH